MRPTRFVLRVATLAALVGCDASRGTVAPPVSPDVAPAELRALTPLAGSGTVSKVFATPLTVRVGNRVGLPVSGATVTFRIATGGGSVSPATVVSDSLGRATATWTLGPTAGAQTLTATVDTVAPVTFTAQAAPGAATAINKVAGDAQSAVVNTAVGVIPSVKVLDAGGNAVPDVVVTFAVATGGGSVAAQMDTTGADGIALAGGWTLGTKSGANTLNASIDGNVVTAFTATGTPAAAASLTLTSDNNTELRAGSTFRVFARAFDAFGNENPASPITFGIIPAQNGRVDRDGNVSVLKAGKLTVYASSGGDGSAGGPAAFATYVRSVIGHPTGDTVHLRMPMNVDPSSVALTDDGIFGVTPGATIAYVVRRTLEGGVTMPPAPIQTIAQTFITVAPKSGGGTAVIASTGTTNTVFWFLDVATHTVVDSMISQRYALAGAMNGDGTRAYFLVDAGELAVIDIATRKLLPSIPLGAGITTMRTAPGDTLAYAYAAVGTMLEIDLKAGRVQRQFAFPAYADVDPGRDVTRFYVLDAGARLVRILRASDFTSEFTFLTNGSTVSATPDSRAVLITSGPYVDIAIGDVVNGYRPGPRYVTSGVPTRVLVSLDGSVAIVPNANGWVDVIR